MTASLPYLKRLKRLPVQERSAGRVEAILDAASDLLAERDPDEVTIRQLAERAGVPTGTIYQFFEDGDAVFQALALRFIAGLPDLVEAPIEQGRTWEETVDLIVNAYADLARSHPAVRSLWLSGVLDSATRAAEDDADQEIASRIGVALQSQSGFNCGTELQWQVLVALIDGLLHKAFTVDPDGDPGLLMETRRAARSYAEAILADG